MRILFRLVAVFGAFCLGCLIYVIAWMTMPYAGFEALIFLPFMAALVSALLVGLSCLVGLLFLIPHLRRVWTWSFLPALALLIASLLLLALGSTLGITETYTNPETNVQFEGLHGLAALGGYFCAVFAVANWPCPKWLQPKPSAGESDPQNTS
jgi:hypothetical protein